MLDFVIIHFGLNPLTSDLNQLYFNKIAYLK